MSIATELRESEKPAMREFRPTGISGFSPELLADPQALRVYKLASRVTARCALQPERVASREGAVMANAGDYIVTAATGEQWPVPRAAFARRYRAAEVPGHYDCVPQVSLALCVNEPFCALLGDGASRLHGQPGDWLLDYGDGSMGVVAADVFAAIYRLQDRSPMAFHQLVEALLLAGVRLPPSIPAASNAAPLSLGALVAAGAAGHACANARAVEAGHRYRSAFWALYLLSVLAVLCAVMPLALGWADSNHRLHAWSAAWAVLEVLIIAALGLVHRRGHRHDWQGQWLASRTEAELAWYLPLVAPLVLPAAPDAPANWYARLAGCTLRMPQGCTIEALCRQFDTVAGVALHAAWDNPVFLAQYVDWATGVFDAQRKHHERLALRSEALMHRIHRINAWLFGLTLGGALAHLVVHSMWLSVATIVFPALGAALHGALAQGESYRRAASSQRLAAGLERTMATAAASLAQGDVAQARRAIEAALVLILDEHRDWHMLVRPHALPLG